MLKGVRPQLSEEFISVPALRSKVMISILLIQAAKCNGVLPTTSFWFGSAPYSRSNLTIKKIHFYKA